MANEKNKLEEVIHLYLGCEVQVRGDIEKLIGVESDGAAITFSGRYGRRIWGAKEVKPLLRQLSDITEEEASDVYTIERDRILHIHTNDHDISRRIGSGIVVTRLDHMNIGLLIRLDGVCYKVIDEGKKPTIEPAMNQPLIFQHLLSKGFDLFSLIETGQAIDKNTLQETKN